MELGCRDLCTMLGRAEEKLGESDREVWWDLNLRAAVESLVLGVFELCGVLCPLGLQHHCAGERSKGDSLSGYIAQIRDVFLAGGLSMGVSF